MNTATIESVLLNIVCNYLSEKKISYSHPLDTTLTDFPLDSLEQVEIFMLIEQHWSINIDAKTIASISSMRDLIPFLEKTPQE